MVKNVNITNLSVNYGKKNILNNINIQLNRGEFTALLGSNGCGKSTFIKAVMNSISHKGQSILELDNGTQLDIARLRNKERALYISYIPQRSGITASMAVLDVCLMGYNASLSLFETPGRKRRDIAVDILNKVGLGGHIMSDYTTLSEGEKQLCILARTLIQNSDVMLLDEPESALDYVNRNILMKKVKDTVSDNKCVLICLHNPELALEYCDRLILMKDGSIAGDVDVNNADIKQLNNALGILYGDIEVVEVKDKYGKVHRNLISL